MKLPDDLAEKRGVIIGLSEQKLTWKQILNVLRSYQSHLEDELKKVKGKKDEKRENYLLSMQSELEVLSLMFAEKLGLDHRQGIEAWRYIKSEVDNIEHDILS